MFTHTLVSPSPWVEATEIAKNLVSVLGIVAGLWVVYRWRRERYDRATDVLLVLEGEFNKPTVRLGRRLIEYDVLYDRLRRHLASMTSAGGRAGRDPRHPGKADRALDALDDMLRFYIILQGVRSAHQVPDIALRQCFRYWLAHYHHPGRLEFKRYIDEYFPTLREWLKEDKKLEGKARTREQGFFRPKDFNWS